MSFSVSSYPDSFIFTFLLEDFLPGRAKIEISAETCLFFVFVLFFRCCCLFVCFVFCCFVFFRGRGLCVLFVVVVWFGLVWLFFVGFVVVVVVVCVGFFVVVVVVVVFVVVFGGVVRASFSSIHLKSVIF